ncbi:biotin/lipoyl-containing protein [Novosphingobium resinovorum]|uniref:Biotin carboxyl carrier protein of acetyl-CoA carboxylase n=1 Tax=Novosphingobium resinovorum TaxID=158500 RepID=A0A031JET6_9SPHN|nr:MULTISPECIES: biotin/lipoyl-containing protein [Novosphingobium]AOR79667.1 acetyl-CoA carboxylase biotin carboxyl carrier protein subunit [Novosphingobium resinovorum]EZP71230.1 Biotin carboxyl carrier subunit of acetyl-CoA carboxylase-like protein [Novosphingobium resinovorum]MBF7013380.1 acetyl-CoA carboxylase biotin carboxyl carrier protein subunit [Novosphingobium sp. HR1a]WJM25531.1 biotin/lipoyl-containing protein [Novosphingobium resinovorum]
MSGKDPDETSLPELELLIAEFKQSGLRELHARCGELEVYLSQDADASGLDAPRVSVAAPVASAAPASKAAPAAAVAAPAGAPAVPDGAVVVTAPYLGTFYRAPKPGAPNYVEVGGRVSAETEVCLVEVMKLFTAVRAGAAGTVLEVLASDGDLVSAGQPLFVIRPE